MDIKSKIILISGPTASGKSNFAIEFAKKNNGEIINADSMQVYKELKILTARPDKKEQKKIKHHLYGIVSVKSNFSTGQWLKLAIKKIREIKKLKKIPILVGGTGLYFNALEKGLVKIPKIPIAFRNKIRLKQKEYGQKKFYNKLLKIDKKVKQKIDPNDIQRSIRAYEVKSFTKKSIYDWIKQTKPYFRESSFLKFYININKENLINRIEKRIKKMIRAGAIDEVKNYRKLNLHNQSSASKIIGIEEIGKFLDKNLKIEKTKELILIRTRQYAKRQKTWARGKMSSWIKIEPRDFQTLLKK
jgi:tRNA dimethylallyltransferase|tara:strand:+ start:637 stop:1542 length:906 start_codon:yes stop_codon:yes gene_type:complete